MGGEIGGEQEQPIPKEDGADEAGFAHDNLVSGVDNRPPDFHGPHNVMLPTQPLDELVRAADVIARPARQHIDGGHPFTGALTPRQMPLTSAAMTRRPIAERHFVVIVHSCRLSFKFSRPTTGLYHTRT